MTNKNKHIHNKTNNKPKESFFIRLFDIISIPFFILLIALIIENQLTNYNFYLESAMYIGLISGLLSLIMYGYAGYRAKKNSSKQIKPSIAGLSLAVIISIIGLILTIFFTPSLDEQLNQLNELNIDNNDNLQDKFSNEDITIENENEITDFEDSIKTFTYIAGIFGIIFSGLLGMLFGMIGGKVAQ